MRLFTGRVLLEIRRLMLLFIRVGGCDNFVYFIYGRVFVYFFAFSLFFLSV